MSPGPTRTQPFAHTKMAQFLSKKIDSLRPETSQLEIARRLGYSGANIISMFKTGHTKVPLEKSPVLAEILGTDVGHLMRLGLEQYWPERLDVIGEVFSRIVTENEMELISEVRRATSDADPKFTVEQTSRITVIVRR